jgi:hypothetical protein
MKTDFPGLAFKNNMIQEEFCDDQRTDPRVRSLAFELAFLANQNNFALEITQIGRSYQSQVNIYGDDRPSGHRELPARAIDFSVRDLAEKSIEILLRHFEDYLKLAPYYSLLYHDVGFGLHLHLQAPHADYNKRNVDHEI